MEELKAHIIDLLKEIEFVHLKQTWVEHLTAAGVPEREAHKWAAEIGHVVDEYKISLRELFGLLQEEDPDRLLLETQSWVAYTQDITVFRIEDAMSHLLERVNPYVPPDPDDEDDLF